jgi:hypothetical protein
MVVSGFWLGTKVDPSVWIIHKCQQTKRGFHLQAMLSELQLIAPSRIQISPTYYYPALATDYWDIVFISQV